MTEYASRAAMEEGFATNGDAIAIAAGLPFGIKGTTNLLHITRIGKQDGAEE
jgi:pyruvate kinase